MDDEQHATSLDDQWAVISDVEARLWELGQKESEYFYTDTERQMFPDHFSSTEEEMRKYYVLEKNPYLDFFNPDHFTLTLSDTSMREWTFPQRFLVMYAVAKGELAYPVARLLKKNDRDQLLIPLSLVVMGLLVSFDYNQPSVFSALKDVVRRYVLDSQVTRYDHDVQMEGDEQTLIRTLRDVVPHDNIGAFDPYFKGKQNLPSQILILALVRLLDARSAEMLYGVYPISTQTTFYTYLLQSMFYPITRFPTHKIKPDIKRFRDDQLDLLERVRREYRDPAFITLYRAMLETYSLVKAYTDIATMKEIEILLPLTLSYSLFEELALLFEQRADEAFSEQTKGWKMDFPVPERERVLRKRMIVSNNDEVRATLLEKKRAAFEENRHHFVLRIFLFSQNLVRDLDVLFDAIRDFELEFKMYDYRKECDLLFGDSEFPVLLALKTGDEETLRQCIAKYPIFFDHIYGDNYVKLINWPYFKQHRLSIFDWEKLYLVSETTPFVIDRNRIHALFEEHKDRVPALAASFGEGDEDSIRSFYTTLISRERRDRYNPVDYYPEALISFMDGKKDFLYAVMEYMEEMGPLGQTKLHQKRMGTFLLALYEISYPDQDYDLLIQFVDVSFYSVHYNERPTSFEAYRRQFAYLLPLFEEAVKRKDDQVVYTVIHFLEAHGTEPRVFFEDFLQRMPLDYVLELAIDDKFFRTILGNAAQVEDARTLQLADRYMEALFYVTPTEDILMQLHILRSRHDWAQEEMKDFNEKVERLLKKKKERTKYSKIIGRETRI